MKLFIKKVIYFALFIFVLMTSACSQADTTTKEEVKEEAVKEEPITLRLAGNDWGFPSPFTHNPRGPGFYNMFLIYDGLLEKDEKGMIPWLAKDWKISEDGKTYTFYLIDDVKWQWKKGKRIEYYTILFILIQKD